MGQCVSSISTLLSWRTRGDPLGSEAGIDATPSLAIHRAKGESCAQSVHWGPWQVQWQTMWG